jgi:hypothetical protein
MHLEQYLKRNLSQAAAAAAAAAAASCRQKERLTNHHGCVTVKTKFHVPSHLAKKYLFVGL